MARTNPYEQQTQRRRGFQPAQRAGSVRGTPQRGRALQTQEPEEYTSYEEEEPRVRGRSAQEEEPVLTKTGKIDRRFRGYRDLPDEEVINPEYRKARTGGTIGGVPVTIDGKPDRRFKENRGLSEEEVMERWLDALNKRFRRQ